MERIGLGRIGKEMRGEDRDGRRRDWTGTQGVGQGRKGMERFLYKHQSDYIIRHLNTLFLSKAEIEKIS